MTNTYHQICLRLVFAVKYRAAVLDKAWRQKVKGVIGSFINEAGCNTIIVNGMEDHMHCFVGLRPAVSVSDLMKTVKAKSSLYFNNLSLTSESFEWQEACLPVGRAMVYSLTGSGMRTRFTSIFRTRKHIIRSKLSGTSTWSY